MKRPCGRQKDPDIWKHVTVLEGNRVKCKHCEHDFAASATRIQSHIYKIKGHGVRFCSRFSQPDNPDSNGDLDENLTGAQGLSILEKTLDCSTSPKTMRKGITASQELQIDQETKHQGRIQFGPFSIFNMGNERDLQLIQYLFNLSPENWVFSSSCSSLTKNDFATLQPQTPLSPLVIDTFANIFTDIVRKKETASLNWYLPVIFSYAALTGDVNSLSSSVERHKMRENYMSDLIRLEKMFIPANVEKKSREHFFLYVVDLVNHEVEIWDSLSDQFINEKERDSMTRKLLFALEGLFWHETWGPFKEFTKFCWRMANDTLLQRNEYDCGIFVIDIMRQSAVHDVKRNPSPQRDSEQTRLDLALMLVKSDLNKLREELYEKAGERHHAQERNGEEDVDLCGMKRKRDDAGEELMGEDVETMKRLREKDQEEIKRLEEKVKLLSDKLEQVEGSTSNAFCTFADKQDDAAVSFVQNSQYVAQSWLQELPSLELTMADLYTSEPDHRFF